VVSGSVCMPLQAVVAAAAAVVDMAAVAAAVEVVVVAGVGLSVSRGGLIPPNIPFTS